MSKRLNTEEFIKKAREIHGDLYDYSKVVYISNKEKVLIIDPVYGEFWQVAGTHLNGKGGCPARRRAESGLNRRKTTEEFIEKSKKLHGDKFDYSETIYVAARTPLTLIVKATGKKISVTPHTHLRPKRDYTKKTKISFKDSFIAKSIAKYGTRYDYSKVVYVDFKTKVKIYDTVKKEWFEQTPRMHLKSKTGNPTESIENGIKKRSLTNEEFIAKSIAFHGEGVFDYSKTFYINFHEPITFIHIPTGKEYKQSPMTHLKEKTIPNIGNRKETDTDHVIPLSIITSSKDRKLYRNRPLFILLDSDMNKKEIPSTKNREKSDLILVDGKLVTARTHRNDYKIIFNLLLENKFSLSFIKDILLMDVAWMNIRKPNALFR